MVSSSFLILALAIAVGHVNCQFGFGRNEPDNRPFNEQIADGCENKVMDLYLILDSSSSIYIEDYRTELQFARDVVSRLDIRSDATRVGALTFSDDYTRPPLGLNRFNSRQEARDGMSENNLPYRTGITNTDQAIRYVNEINDFRQDITKVIVVVTDGGSRSPGATAAEAQRARENGFYVFVVGVGQYLDESEWRTIANDPDEQYLYNITNYRFLSRVRNSLPLRACSLPPIILRETCDVNYPAEVYFVAARSTTEDALRLINNFKANTRDIGADLRLNYMIETCNYATGVLVRDDGDICDRLPRRLFPESGDSISQLMIRARNAARSSSEGAGRQRSQTFVLFVDDNTMSSSGTVWGQEATAAKQLGVNVVVVDLGLFSYRGFLSRFTQDRDHIVPFLGTGTANERETRNTFVERTCGVLNTPANNVNFNGTPT